MVYLPGMVPHDWRVLWPTGEVSHVTLAWRSGDVPKRVWEAIIRFDREVRAERDTHFFASAVTSDPDAREYETKCGMVASKFGARDFVTCAECLEAADAR